MAECIINLGSAVLLTLLVFGGTATAALLDADKDFVSAIPTTVDRLVLAKATRAWRGGMRTLIALNDSDAAQRLSAGVFPDNQTTATVRAMPCSRQAQMLAAPDVSAPNEVDNRQHPDLSSVLNITRLLQEP
jgi:hypothetical protein